MKENDLLRAIYPKIVLPEAIYTHFVLFTDRHVIIKKKNIIYRGKKSLHVIGRFSMTQTRKLQAGKIYGVFHIFRKFCGMHLDFISYPSTNIKSLAVPVRGCET